MKTSFVSILFIVAGLMALLMPRSDGDTQEDFSGIFVNHATIEQNYDPQAEQLIIFGQVENSLSVDVRNVVLRLYVPGPEDPAKTWDINLNQMDSLESKQFWFRIPVREIETYETFVVRVWRYELVTKDVQVALNLAQDFHPVTLRVIVGKVVELTSVNPSSVIGAFENASSLERLCLIEATLIHTNPVAMQYLVEGLLANQVLVDEDGLEMGIELASLVSEPSPFPQIERWRPSGNPEEDLERLVSTFQQESIPMLVRMKYLSNLTGRQFAARELEAAGWDNFSQQWDEVKNGKIKVSLLAVYRELVADMPDDAQIRLALGKATIQQDKWFLFIGAGIALLFPLTFAWRALSYDVFTL
ncbi:MAG: hypothetical protein FJ010_05130 [Chloroflexi bacterium]|nr:hypothetical protein [Chloroflexota bacterium]